MKRILAIVFAWFALLSAVAQAAPSRPLYEPPPPAAPDLDLRGTTWQGKDHVENYWVTFETDGTLSYGYLHHNHERDGRWKREGNRVSFEVNKGYRQFSGSVNGNVLQGNSWNVDGAQWQTMLFRVKAPNMGAAP